MKKQRLYFILCSLLSITVQLAIVVTSRIGALFNSAGLDTLSAWIVESTPLKLAVFEFLAVFFIAHFFFYFFLYQIYRLATEQLPGEGKRLFYIFLFHALAFLVLLAINAHLYPRSLFAWAAQPLLEQGDNQIKQGLLFALFGLFCLFAFWRLMRRVTLIPRTKKWLVIASVMGVFFYQISSSQHRYDGAISHPAFKQPNVILIGVDSLRPDLIDERLTPNLARIAEQSLTFSNAYTPIGRTFPAWVSILTGNDPIHNGTRFNLAARDKIKAKNTLAKDLEKAGYRTVFAMDEKRFANIDESYGFDTVIGPPIGLRDFLLGSISDFPVLNLLRQLPIAKQLLPDSYDNRAVSALYKPENFDYLLEQTLAENNSHPFFLAVHYCLPHWPYTWADVDSYPAQSSPTGVALNENYLKAIHRADQQVGQLLSQLESRGYLQNAIVFFLSDHPESFANEPAWNGYDIEKGPLNIAISSGHGMALSRPDLPQVMLMVRRYGQAQAQVGLVTKPVSLVDIRPTILSMLGIKTKDTMDGIPLFASDNKGSSNHRALYFETGLRLSHMSSPKIDQVRVIKDGIEYYDIDPSLGRLVLKTDYYDSLVAKKEVAVLKDSWLLSLAKLKDTNGLKKSRIVLTHKDNYLPAEMEALTVADELMKLLCDRFQHDPAEPVDCIKFEHITGDSIATQQAGKYSR